MQSSIQPVELSFPVPKNLSSILHLHLTAMNGYAMVHLTTTTIGESAGSTAPLGSFVYAMPDVS